MCSSVEFGGHTFVDRPNSEYVDGLGRRRVWQDCTGCGNVENRELTTATFAVIGETDGVYFDRIQSVFEENVSSERLATVKARAYGLGWRKLTAVVESF